MHNPEEKQSPGQKLLDFFRTHHFDHYGEVVSGDTVRKVLEIELPAIGTRCQFQSAAMAELSAVDVVRKALLKEGKYLSAVKGDYRVLLPSENALQVMSYMESADRKLKRALILSKNTPGGAQSEANQQTQARIVLKTAAIKNTKIFGESRV